MVAAYTYGPFAVVDPSTSRLVTGSTGGKLVLVKDGAAQAIYDANGSPISTLSTNEYGQPAVFRADIPFGLVQFGTIVQTVQSNEVYQYAIDAQNASAIASAAQATASQALALAQAGGSGGGAADWDLLLDKPATFPPSSHTHPAGQISDASSVGQALMKAADAQAARVAIGAGTGNGTSNLALGATATTAAAGNHTHAASGLTFTPTGALTAQTVQDAIVQASQTGSGSGTSQVYVWRYSAGAYPALPTTKPAGVLEVRALGPTYPTTLPAWVGLGASQIPLSYSKVSVA